MSSILSGALLVLALISTSAVAQGNTEDSKIMSQLTTGAYSGPYFKGDASKPLLVIRNEQGYYKLDASAIEEINPDWIESVNILKGKSAVDIFGESGVNGAVLITLKENDKAARRYFRSAKKDKLKI